MAAASLADDFAAIVDDDKITGVSKVVDQVLTNGFVTPAFVDNDQGGRHTMGTQHLIELTKLESTVAQCFPIDGVRLAKNLRARFGTSEDNAFLCMPG